MITIARIDERLIHGQVAYSWTVAYKSDAVVAIDEEAAANKFQKDLLMFACPKNMKCFVVGEEKAAELLAKYPGKKFFLVAKYPSVFLRLAEAGIKIDSVNVGGIYFKPGRRQITKTVFVDEELASDLKKMHDMGITLDFRSAPSDKGADLVKLL